MTNTHKVQGIIKDDRRVESRRIEGKVCPTTQPQRRNWVGRRKTPHNYFVGERERRVKQLLRFRGGPYILSGRRITRRTNRRKTPPSYDSRPKPKLLVYVKVEPELHPDTYYVRSSEHGYASHNKYHLVLDIVKTPYQKDDILELDDPEMLIMQIKVEKVIGVEEIELAIVEGEGLEPHVIVTDKKWHTAILGEEM